MKTARKVLLLALCAALLVSATVMGTLAYLTADAGTVTNTFTVGSIKFDPTLKNAMDEAKVDEYGKVVGTERVTANTYKLVPGGTYTKDPTIHMATDNEACYLFVKVTNGIAPIEAAGDTTIAKQIEANWTKYNDEGYYYKELKANEGGDQVVFSSFTLANNANVADYENASIVIKACAVQKAGLDLDAAYTEAAAKIEA